MGDFCPCFISLSELSASPFLDSDPKRGNSYYVIIFLLLSLKNSLWPQSDSSTGYKEKSPINQSNRTKSKNRWPNSGVKNTFTDLIAFKRNTQIFCGNIWIHFNNTMPLGDDARPRQKDEGWREGEIMPLWITTLKQEEKTQTSIYNKENGT